MRVLLLGNAPWTMSGYAEQIALLIPRLKAAGHEVAVAANHGLQNAPTVWQDTLIYPSSDTWSNAGIGLYAEHFEADVVICLHDAWVMKPDLWPDDFRMAIWAPVDHYPPPPPVLGVLNHDKVQPIAMSRFGERFLSRLDALYAPHAVDTTVFRPQPEARDAVRAGMGIGPGDFLIGVVGANRGWQPDISRKCLPQILQAFARFLPEHPDAWLYMHTDPKPVERGTPLEPLIMALNAATPGLMDRVRFPSERELLMGVRRDLLAAQYAAFDVLLNPSMGEGFGVPILEAQACGVPAIVSEHSAMTELVGPGWLVAGDPWWHCAATAFAYMPYIPSIVAALEMAYEDRDNPERRQAAADFAQQYDADFVFTEYWEPILETLSGPREVPPLNGKERKKARKRAAKARRVAA